MLQSLYAFKNSKHCDLKDGAATFESIFLLDTAENFGQRHKIKLFRLVLVRLRAVPDQMMTRSVWGGGWPLTARPRTHSSLVPRSVLVIVLLARRPLTGEECDVDGVMLRAA